MLFYPAAIYTNLVWDCPLVQGAAANSTVVTRPTRQVAHRKHNCCTKRINSTWLQAAGLCIVLLCVILACFVIEAVIRWNSVNSPVVAVYVPHTKKQRDAHKAIVRHVNEDPKKLWKAVYNQFATSADELERMWTKGKAVAWSQGAHKLRHQALAEVMAYFGGNDSNRIYLEELLKDNMPIPEEFDARQKWPTCYSIGHVPNQGQCGSCWAIAATSVMSDRICIASNGKMQPLISTQDLLSCCTVCGSCWGGATTVTPFLAWEQQGFVSGGEMGSRSGCRPYEIDSLCGAPCSPMTYGSSTKLTCVKQCQSLFQGKYETDLYFGKSTRWLHSFQALDVLREQWSSLRKELPPREAERYWKNLAFLVQYHDVDLNPTMLTTPSPDPDIMTPRPLNLSLSAFHARNKLIKLEVIKNGPVKVCFTVNEDFQHYKEGVYSHIAGYPMYGHCTKLIGWGKTAEGRPFWTIVNSWGRDWGENGYFRMLNEWIESGTDVIDDVATGYADIERTIALRNNA